MALFAAARRRRRRRRSAAALLGLVLVGSLLAGLSAWPHQAVPRSVSRSGRGATAAGFTLPGAAVAWVDYNGGLHVGDVATQAQHVLATIPASADGRYLYLVQAEGSLVELPVNGSGGPRTLRAPAGWSFDSDQAVVGGILVDSQPRHATPRLGIWSPGTARVRIIADGAARSIGAGTAPGARYSLVAWTSADCPFASDCPVEITNTATLATISVRSPLHHGFASTGVVFSPSGTELAAWARAVSLSSQCCANTSELAIIDVSAGVVHLVPAASLVTQEDAGWILWLPGGQRLLAGAASYSYAVDASTAAARPFFFFPQAGDGPNADHDIMDTPDINFSAVLIPAISSPGRSGAF
jgi:hypothetical protein